MATPLNMFIVKPSPSRKQPSFIARVLGLAISLSCAAATFVGVFTIGVANSFASYLQAGGDLGGYGAPPTPPPGYSPPVATPWWIAATVSAICVGVGTYMLLSAALSRMSRRRGVR